MAKILVVDDIEEERYLPAKMLGASHEVIGVADPIEAFYQLRQSKFDLILIDIRLDGTDGLQLARTIRQGTTHANTPIIAITGYQDFSLAEVIDSGCNDFMAKGYTTEQLQWRVDYWLHPTIVSNLAKEIAATKEALNQNKSLQGRSELNSANR